VSTATTLSVETTFLDRAQILINLGIPVIPLPPGKKGAVLPEWPKKATTDLGQVLKWDAENDQYNCAAVFKAVPGGFWALEVDGPKILDKCKAETGEWVPSTFAVRSRPGRGHFYFKHTKASIAMGNIPQDEGDGFSVRADNQYCVSPGSIHPHTGQPYEIVHNVTPIEAPDDFVAWLAKQKKVKTIAQKADGWMDQPILFGTRDNTLTKIGGVLRNRGFDEESIYAVLSIKNERQCKDKAGNPDPMSDVDIRRISHSVARYKPGETTLLIGGVPKDGPDADNFVQPDPQATGEGVNVLWGDPRPFEMGLPPVLPFDITCLPCCLRSLVQDVSERFGVPVEFAASTALNALAGVVGRRAFVFPREFDKKWKESLNLWGGIIAGPGDKKTPLMNAILEPMNRVRLEWEQEYKDAETRYAQEVEAYEKEVKKLEAAQTKRERELEKAEAKKSILLTEEHIGTLITRDDVGKKVHSSSVEVPSNNIVLAPPTPPVKRMFMVNECTPEYLQDTNAENPEGLFSVRDELSGLVVEMDSKGRELQRPLFLAAWSGNTVYGVGRMTREGKTAMLCWSLFGGFQPDTVRKFLENCMEVVDGMFPRFQNFVWPDPLDLVAREGVDRPANEEAICSVEKIFRTLLDMKEGQIDLHFAKGDAQKTFNDWYHGLHVRIAQEPVLHFKQHLSKYPGLMPILAGLFQLADIVAAYNEHSSAGGAPPLGTREIDREHAEQAIKTVVWLESHARRIYSCIKSPFQLSAEALAKHLLAGDLEGGFTVRDVQRKGWTNLKDDNQIADAVVIFEELEWLRGIQVKSARGGRPTTKYEINPRLNKRLRHAEPRNGG
jgi:hypothetical protein